MARSAFRLAVSAAALCAVLLHCGPARADTGEQTLQAGPSPVVRIQARAAQIVVRTWNRPEIQVVSTADVRAIHFGPAAVDRAIPGGDVPIFSTQIAAAGGPVVLPQEDFPVDGLAGSAHDGVAILGGDEGADIVVTAPAGSALIFANVGRGSVQISGYHGAMVAEVHNGGVRIDNASGEAFLQAARGSIVVSQSSFVRIRARTGIGNVVFSRCSVRQIEVNAVRGHIAYDDGTFSPGLARFETDDGNVALGIASGGVQIGAHSGSGRIVSEFNRPSGPQNDVTAIVNGGGPVVTASSQKGSVFLYSGSMREKPGLVQQVRRRVPAAFPKVRTCARPRCPI